MGHVNAYAAYTAVQSTNPPLAPAGLRNDAVHRLAPLVALGGE